MTTRLHGQGVHDPNAPPAREWLIADGAGGSAYGTEVCVPARRAHAWLHVPGFGTPVTALLLGLEERVRTDAGTFALAAWPGPDAPATPALVEEFGFDLGPVWRYRLGALRLERSLFMIQGHSALVVSYRHLEGPAARLRSSPLVVARAPSDVQRENPELRGLAQGIPGRVRIDTVPGGPSLTLWHPGSFLPNRAWRRGIEHSSEPRKSREDALVPGHLECDLAPGAEAHLVVSTEEALFRTLAIEGRLGTPPPKTLAGCVAALAHGERARREAERTLSLRGADTTARQAAAARGDAGLARRPAPLVEPHDGWTASLAWAATQGLARRGGRLTMLDPLPDAVDGGASTLRGLPGLVSIRAFDPVREVLRGMLAHLDDGLAPIAFEADGRPLFGSADPALWVIHVVELMVRRSGDAEWVRDLHAQLESVFQYYRGGTAGGVRVAADGLLQTGDEGVKPAALNVLWYHALVAMAQLARVMGRKENGAFYLAWARQHGQCFNETLWDERTGGLRDLGGEGDRPGGLVPSHLLAVSLTPSILPPERASRLVERAERELFTPLGLRPHARAGWVEPAWLGAFHGAYLRVHGRSPESQARVSQWMDALRAKLERATTGHVPATFEWPGARQGSARGPEGPSIEEARPRGASPLAAAELLRIRVEEMAQAAEPAGVT